MSAILVEYGRRVREARGAAGLTLRDLGAATGLSISHLSCIERGRNSPGIETVARLHGALGVGLPLPGTAAGEEYRRGFRFGYHEAQRHYTTMPTATAAWERAAARTPPSAAATREETTP